MKFICDRANKCDIETCPHRQPHDDCGHTCQRVAGVVCVMDMESLPEIPDTPGTTWAVMIWRREEAA